MSYLIMVSIKRFCPGSVLGVPEAEEMSDKILVCLLMIGKSQGLEHIIQHRKWVSPQCSRLPTLFS